jgi:2-phosphosulfolactate phosphatase
LYFKYFSWEGLLVKVEICFTAQELTPSLAYGKTIVILDVFRTSSTIITALAKGAARVIPACSPENAVALKKHYPCSLLGGEYQNERIASFDLGNSPLEYTHELIKDKTVILSTTNGTGSIHIAGEAGAAKILIGSFLNAHALAKRLQEDLHDILVVCVGTQGEFSLEDTCCAGYLLHLLQGTRKLFINDRALNALALYQCFQQNLPYNLSQSRNGRALLLKGQWSDIEYCCLTDLFATIPFYSADGIVDASKVRLRKNKKSAPNVISREGVKRNDDQRTNHLAWQR